MARFTNQAQLCYGRSIANSNIAVGEILEVLSAAKEAVRNTYRQNDTITYVISIVNAGTLAYTGLTITDNLGAYPYNTTTLVPLDYMEGTAKYYTAGTGSNSRTATCDKWDHSTGRRQCSDRIRSGSESVCAACCNRKYCKYSNDHRRRHYTDRGDRDSGNR